VSSTTRIVGRGALRGGPVEAAEVCGAAEVCEWRDFRMRWRWTPGQRRRSGESELRGHWYGPLHKLLIGLDWVFRSEIDPPCDREQEGFPKEDERRLIPVDSGGYKSARSAESQPTAFGKSAWYGCRK